MKDIMMMMMTLNQDSDFGISLYKQQTPEKTEELDHASEEMVLRPTYDLETSTNVLNLFLVYLRTWGLGWRSG
jgi:hypothetical protein